MSAQRGITRTETDASVRFRFLAIGISDSAGPLSVCRVASWPVRVELWIARLKRRRCAYACTRFAPSERGSSISPMATNHSG